MYRMLTVYTKPGCAPCVQTKRYLDKNEIPYVAKDITLPENTDEFSSLNVKSVPVISNGRENLVGFNPMKIKSMLSGVQ